MLQRILPSSCIPLWQRKGWENRKIDSLWNISLGFWHVSLLPLCFSFYFCATQLHEWILFLLSKLPCNTWISIKTRKNPDGMLLLEYRIGKNYFFGKNVLKGLSRNSVAKRRSKDAQQEILLTWKRASPLIEFQNSGNINFLD